ncbi:MAG TPA: lytic transglycosylase domain-containing protein [Micavibrio sp.]
MSLVAVSLISNPMNALAEPAFAPAHKPAAMRADPLALLRYPALNETATAALPPMIPAEKPKAAAQSAVKSAAANAAKKIASKPALIPTRKPAYQGPALKQAVNQPPAPTKAAATTSPSANPEKFAKLARLLGLKDKSHPEALTLVKPVSQKLPALDGTNKIYKTAMKRTPAQRDSVVRLVGIVKQDVSNGSPSRALKRLSADKAVPYLDPVEKDQLRSVIARGFLLAGKLEDAYALAAGAASRSGAYIPQAGWIAGLAAWRMDDFADAARNFANSANATHSSAWQTSASAYWASRAYARAHQPQHVSAWLKKAAEHPRTFYGLIATRSLGLDYDFNWDMPALTSAHKKLLQAHPQAAQAMALVKQSKPHAASQMLAKIDTNGNPALREALMVYAAHKNLSAFAMQLAQTQPHPEGGYYDAALYPLIPWKPRDGYTVDRALVHAIIRQESKFNPGAISHRGAQGLMQLMPSTANYIIGKALFKGKDSHQKLRDPQTNLDVGQRYIEKLLNQDHVDAELFSLVAAYNAGPGNLRKWKREMAEMKDDPLLFIESIPMGETRAYVERVMASYWIYRLRMNQSVPSLDAVAGGQWAQYSPPTDLIKQAGIPTLSDLRGDLMMAATN